MTNAEIIVLFDRLRAQPAETEWLEFKRSHAEPQDIGEYLSALANEACLRSQPRGYQVFAIDDATRMGARGANRSGRLRSPLQMRSRFDLAEFVSLEPGPAQAWCLKILRNQPRMPLLIRAARRPFNNGFNKGRARPGPATQSTVAKG